jgi:putative transposase
VGLAAARRGDSLGKAAKHLIHDRDAVYGRNFGARLANLGIASVRTPVRAPRANAIAERLVRTLRSEALDHIIVLYERHLHAVLAEFVTYYNRDRPHRSLGLQSPLPRSPTALRTVVRRPVLGGLHHAYARVA